jgi:hypothetical protein
MFFAVFIIWGVHKSSSLRPLLMQQGVEYVNRVNKRMNTQGVSMEDARGHYLSS